MVKRRPFMYNINVKKTFEILRSEITFLIDLYIIFLVFEILCHRSHILSAQCDVCSCLIFLYLQASIFMILSLGL